MRQRKRILESLTSGAVALGLAVFAGPAASAGAAGDVYPLSTCPVTGQTLGSMGDPVVYSHEGREIRFCCRGCVEPFKKDSPKYIQKIDAEIIRQETPDYPLDTCVVSGEKLDEMGKPYDYVYRNRLVRFCCAGCRSSFDKDPAKYAAKLDQAVIDRQKAGYPLDTCVVSGGKLGAMGEPVDYVFANRLVRFCCGGCIKTFEKDPVKYTARIDEAAAAKRSSDETAPADAGSASTPAKSSGEHEHTAGRGEGGHNE